MTARLRRRATLAAAFSRACNLRSARDKADLARAQRRLQEARASHSDAARARDDVNDTWRQATAASVMDLQRIATWAALARQANAAVESLATTEADLRTEHAILEKTWSRAEAMASTAEALVRAQSRRLRIAEAASVLDEMEDRQARERMAQ